MRHRNPKQNMIGSLFKIPNPMVGANVPINLNNAIEMFVQAPLSCLILQTKAIDIIVLIRYADTPHNWNLNVSKYIKKNTNNRSVLLLIFRFSLHLSNISHVAKTPISNTSHAICTAYWSPIGWPACTRKHTIQNSQAKFWQMAN